tara:strand:+ start:3310 stop:4557 length:1248 start_codon:yes stop_codon:yes gene_type:complete
MILFLNIIAISLLGFRGLFEVIGILSTSNLIALLLILLAAFFTSFQKKVYVPLLATLLIFLGSGLISMILNSTDLMSYVLYNRTVIVFPFIFLFLMINEKYLKNTKLIRDIFLIFLILQIPAYFIKFFILGFSEDPAGTISAREGSATTLLSLIGVAYFFTRYLSAKGKMLPLIMIFLFIVISQINEKRAVLILIPLIMFFIYYQTIKDRKRINLIIFNSFLIILLLLPLWVYLIARINPFLNPSGELFGEFDINFLITFISSYTYRPDVEIYDYSRIQSILYVLNFMLNSDPIQLIFGQGLGTFLPGKFDVAESIGVRYGARMGFVWILLQHGFLGLMLIIYFFYNLIRRLEFINAPKNYQRQYIFTKSLLVILAFDFFFYSSTALFYPYFIGFFLAQFAYTLKLKYNVSKQIS